MKVIELKDLSLEDLKKREDNLRDDIFKLRFQKGIGQLDNIRRLSQVRKDLARVKTVARQLAVQATIKE